ncbi:MAG: transglycosylase SLT domain-containing protein [Oligoflexia bacterium]|nr:transglycosylase SLT domain-containing protein [Oligoflexia bacterium]
MFPTGVVVAAMDQAKKPGSVLLIGIALSVLTGCATTRGVPEKAGRETRTGAPRTVAEVIQQGPLKPSQSVNYGEITVQGVKLKNTQFDYPITINSRVEYWVDYFTGRGRPHFERYLERSEFFIPYIEPILKQNGMPLDLVYLAMIESGFNNHARSHARAVGPWQFISATGKRYGLMVNWWVDERRDIRKSTLAAVEYLSDLYRMFGAWELAAAGYNAGEAKIARAIQRYGSKDFWVLSRHRYLRQETRDYVPKIIAAALIAKNREQFGFRATKHNPAADEAIAADGEVVKVIKTDKPEEGLEQDPEEKDLRELGKVVQASADSAALGEEDAEDEDSEEPSDDPAQRRITPATLLVPLDSQLPEGQLANNDSQPLAKPVPTPHVTKDGQVGGEEIVEFDVRSPADLLKVARAAGLSYQTVKALNPELSRWCTPPALNSYRLKLPASAKEKFLSTYNHTSYPREVKFMTYKIRRGETLTHVARHFGINVDPIADLNGVSARMPLKSGVHVMLPIPLDRSRSLASLDLKDPPSKKRVRGKRGRGGNRYYKVTYKKREAARKGSRKGDKS